MNNKFIIGIGIIVAINLILSIVGLVGVNQLSQTKLGGTTNYDAMDVSDGYMVDGTTIIDGSGGLAITATSSIRYSYDGFIAWGDMTIATTSTAGYYTNNASPMMCDGDSLSIYWKTPSTFMPSLVVSVGTTTSGYSAAAYNLVASTTMATSTAAANKVIDSSYTAPFYFGSGWTIVANLADITNATASSTYYSTLDAEFGLHCWLLGQ